MVAQRSKNRRTRSYGSIPGRNSVDVIYNQDVERLLRPLQFQPKLFFEYREKSRDARPRIGRTVGHRMTGEERTACK